MLLKGQFHHGSYIYDALVRISHHSGRQKETHRKTKATSKRESGYWQEFIRTVRRDDRSDAIRVRSRDQATWEYSIKKFGPKHDLAKKKRFTFIAN